MSEAPIVEISNAAEGERVRMLFGGVLRSASFIVVAVLLLEIFYSVLYSLSYSDAPIVATFINITLVLASHPVAVAAFFGICGGW